MLHDLDRFILTHSGDFQCSFIHIYIYYLYTKIKFQFTTTSPLKKIIPTHGWEPQMFGFSNLLIQPTSTFEPLRRPPVPLPVPPVPASPSRWRSLGRPIPGLQPAPGSLGRQPLTGKVFFYNYIPKQKYIPRKIMNISYLVWIELVGSNMLEDLEWKPTFTLLGDAGSISIPPSQAIILVSTPLVYWKNFTKNWITLSHVHPPCIAKNIQ